MHRLKAAIPVLTAAMLVGGCETEAQRRAAENVAIKKEAAREIDRICSLPESERAAELKKLKDESGYELFCGRTSK